MAWDGAGDKWFLRGQTLIRKGKSLRRTPKTDAANAPPYLPRSADAGGSITGAGQIAGAQAFGGVALAPQVAAAGVASAEAFGQPTVAPVSVIDAAGISSAEAFGAPAVSAGVAAAGIVSAEAFGAAVVGAVVAAAGVASAEALGQPGVAATIATEGIARQPDVALLLDMETGADGSTTFIDRSGAARTVTANGNAQVDTTAYKFGTRSALFDGAGDYLECGDSPGFDIGTADFTVELWFLRDGGAEAAENAIVCLRLTADSDTLYLYHQRSTHPTNPHYLALSDSTATRIYSNAALPANTWVHLAWCRIGGVHKLFVGGVLQAATWSSGGSPAGAYDPTAIRIGLHPLGVQPLRASLDEVRITNGLARYTGSFTPPIAAFPGDESPGLAAVAATIGAAGIAGAEAFGQPVVAGAGATIDVAGIATAEAFGAPALAAGIDAAGIASAEAFGQPALAAGVAAAGIASAEAFGLAALVLEIDCTGIATGEAFGQPVVGVPGAAHDVVCAGIDSAEAFGACRLEVPATGYLPTGSFPVLKDLQRRAHRIGGVGGVGSGEAFGLPSVAPVLGAVGIGSTARLGGVRITRRPTPAQLMDEQLMLMS